MSDEPKDLGRRLGNLGTLPDEVVKLLNTNRLDPLEEQVVTILRKLEGVATIDEIIVELYRGFGFIPPDRRFLASKLYRMTKAAHIESVPKRKGVFRLRDVTADDLV